LPILDRGIEYKIFDQVLRLLEMLTDKGLRDFFSLHAILDELKRLTQAESPAKALVAPHLASTLSQLSIMSECPHQFHQFQPWAQKIESTIEEQGPRNMADYDTIFRVWGSINNIYAKFRIPQLFKVGYPKDGTFFYPAEKSRTRETVRSVIAAEAALEAFWTAPNAHFRRYIGTSPVALVKHIIGGRTLQRTPPWTESPELASEIAAQRERFISFAGHLHDISSQITGNLKKLTISSQDKKKTHRIDLDNAEANPSMLIAPSNSTSRILVTSFDSHGRGAMAASPPGHLVGRVRASHLPESSIVLLRSSSSQALTWLRLACS
jgi:hypothetical protein